MPFLDFKKNLFFWASVLLFIGANAVLVSREIYLLLGLPFFLFVVFMAVNSLVRLYWTIVLFVPFSVPLKDIVGNVGFDLSLPV